VLGLLVIVVLVLLVVVVLLVIILLLMIVFVLRGCIVVGVAIVSGHAPQTNTRGVELAWVGVSLAGESADNDCMNRPCFLVVDREYSGSISTRKLVIETAKLNVITAYSGGEAIEALKRFPLINGVVIDAGIKDMSCAHLVEELRGIDADLPLIVVNTPGSEHCPGATHYLESFEPAKLLELLKTLTPKEAAVIEARNEHLSKTQD